MIHTEWSADKDLKEQIAPGARVGILACSDCAAACGTADTKRLEQVREDLEGHCQVLFSASLESPCDQRGFRLLSRTVEGFDQAEVLVVLACEAGSRSVGDRVKSSAVTVVAPLATRGFHWTRTDGSKQPACVFCLDCSQPERYGPCPVAVCPVHKPEGPCQQRNGRFCPLDETLVCPWLS